MGEENRKSLFRLSSLYKYLLIIPKISHTESVLRKKSKVVKWYLYLKRFTRQTQLAGPCAAKVARTVWSGENAVKHLPIATKTMVF